MADTDQDMPSRREQRRLQHQQASREHLLDAAEEVFGRKGYFATTLKEIAELAEFSVGSVYSFFASKEDLYTQIFVRRGSQHLAEMRDVLGRDTDDPLAQLHGLVDFEVAWLRRHRNYGRLYLRHSSAGFLESAETNNETMASNYKESLELQEALFERGQAAGALRRGDPEVLARLLAGIMISYELLDPAIMSDDPDAEARMPLADLHDIVGTTFRA